jgi:5'-3' exonuclease
VAVLLEVLDALGVATAGMEGYEADDVLGTLAMRDTGAVDVVTGDRDLLQLVRDDRPVRILYTVEKMRPYDEAAVRAKYGIPGGRTPTTPCCEGIRATGSPA